MLVGQNNITVYAGFLNIKSHKNFNYLKMIFYIIYDNCIILIFLNVFEVLMFKLEMKINFELNSSLLVIIL